MESTFYKQLLNEYINLQFPPLYSEVTKIGGPISWYLADSQDNLISVEKGENYIVDIDIQSAFPTICRNLYGNDSEFIKKMDSIEEKRGKNIFIATSLKGKPLKTINNISKLTILGVIFDISQQESLDDIDILELKKDGCLIVCKKDTWERLKNIHNLTNRFTSFIINSNFYFHIKENLKYVRCNRTSFVLDDSQKLSIKGKYKNCPSGLKEIIERIFLKKSYNINDLLTIYSNKYFKLLRNYNLINLLNKYYLVDNKAIDSGGEYKIYNSNLDIDPRMYLKIFVFPAILSEKTKI